MLFDFQSFNRQDNSTNLYILSFVVSDVKLNVFFIKWLFT